MIRTIINNNNNEIDIDTYNTEDYINSIYCCIYLQSQGHSYGGHSSHVTNASFLYDDSRLVTTGGKDTAVFQWELLG